MIIVEVYSKTQIETPVASMSYSGKGKTITIEAEDKAVIAELKEFSETVLGLSGQGLAFPADRQYWMESLPKVDASVPYLFKIANPISEITEEVKNDNEEDNGKEGNGKEYNDGGNAADDGESNDNGGNGDGLDDPSHSRIEDGGNTDGGYDNHNG